jgi:hypothetical protein
MKFSKLTWTEQQDVADKAIREYLENMDIEDDRDTRAPLIDLLETLGVEIDGCSICGRMPMDSICNNAGCSI